MRKLAILGFGGHGKVLADIAFMVGYDAITFFDDESVDSIPEYEKRWVLGGTSNDLLRDFKMFHGMVLGIGNCHERYKKHKEFLTKGAQTVTLVHPHAFLSRHSSIGRGSVICAGGIINIDTHIGDACIVNTGATVDHDCKVGDAVHIAPGVHISGNVTIGKESWIGVGSTVKQGVTIGSNVIVGAGSVVLRDIDDGKTVFGNPSHKENI